MFTRRLITAAFALGMAITFSTYGIQRNGIKRVTKNLRGGALRELCAMYRDILGNDGAEYFREIMCGREPLDGVVRLAQYVDDKIVSIIVFRSFFQQRMSKCCQVGHILWLMTAREYRGKGYGSALLQAACKRLIAQKKDAILMYVDTVSETAQQNCPTVQTIYERCGFEWFGQVGDKYRFPGSDSSYRVLWRNLCSNPKKWVTIEGYTTEEGPITIEEDDEALQEFRHKKCVASDSHSSLKCVVGSAAASVVVAIGYTYFTRVRA